ncbi:alpha-galactosidase [Clostridium sp. Marseille-P2415]|uniref:alpha-galactosidase n=1 Tax=Clostridium sp. Marseille-P2415 TaxID=1805471 RepID=UPI0009888324|nr:alpha-galactosidase [Clostridium sp. Marseille-P2415]
MGILFLEESREFCLYNKEISYIFQILKNGQLGQLYYGKHLHNRSYAHLLELGRRDMANCSFEGDSAFSLEHIKQEYPSYGSGDVRYPAYEILQKNGSRVTMFQYTGHRIYPGKPKLKGLPATYVEDDREAATLEITLEDRLIQTKLILNYTIYEDWPVITRNARFECDLEEGIILTNAQSLCLDLPDSDYDMLDLTGAWGRERNVKIHPLHQGIQGVYSMRGHSSHQYNPFLVLKRRNADEQSGEVIGASFVYSGNFQAQIEVDPYDTARILLGIHPNGFAWRLKKGESFQSPEAVLVYSDRGLNYMSQTFHRLYRTRLARGEWRDKERPILVNNWEATYMKFNEEKILSIAGTAKKLGIELFVLDDGWFGKRNDDTTSLGDWYPNLEKLPNGITGLAKKITDLGLKFGLWFEPEMISKDSCLYRVHPDWMLGTPNRRICHSRNQYVLDFTRQEVIKYIGDVMEDILDKAPVSYVKWDMNRGLSDVYSAGNDAGYQSEIQHRYILGVYQLYERLTTRFPHVLFESCASGGARFDPGMLYYAPQCWTSDDTDAVERLKIQYGTSMVYPLDCMGSHVSAVPNHQTMRNISLKTRADVAYFGTFGYELDLNKLTAEEQEEIKTQIVFMKRFRSLIHEGDFYRLLSPFEGTETSWMAVSPDQKKALVGYYREKQPVNIGYRRLKLSGLGENIEYRISDRSTTHYGDELMQTGLTISDTPTGIYTPDIDQGDYQSRLFLLTAI